MNKDTSHDQIWSSIDSLISQVASLTYRMTKLETRPCSPDSSASPAAASAGSGGTAHADSAAPRTVSGADTGNDPTAAIRADPRRPGECPDCGSAVECEHDTWWCTKWSCKYHERWSIPRENWPHVPQPAPAELESIIGTASAAKAVEQGVADAVEGRTVKIPDPLDQLAAEAQAEGEYGKPRKYKDCVVIDGGKPSDYRLADEPKTIRGTGGPITPPTPRRTAREVAILTADRIYANNGKGFETTVQIIAAAIEHDREGR